MLPLPRPISRATVREAKWMVPSGIKLQTPENAIFFLSFRTILSYVSIYKIILKIFHLARFYIALHIFVIIEVSNFIQFLFFDVPNTEWKSVGRFGFVVVLYYKQRFHEKLKMLSNFCTVCMKYVAVCVVTNMLIKLLNLPEC